MESDTSQTIEPPHRAINPKFEIRNLKQINISLIICLFGIIVRISSLHKHLPKNLPSPLFAKEGELILPLAKGGKEGFFNNTCSPYYKTPINCLFINHHVA
jgi:hypothetical protein